MRQWLWGLLIILVVQSVLAQNSSLTCEYQEQTPGYELKEVLVTSAGSIIPPPLEIGAVTIKQAGSPCWFSFTVKNKADLTVAATFSYKLDVIDTLGGHITEDEYGVIIQPHESATPGRSWEDVTSCEFIDGSIITHYRSTSDVKVEMRQVPTAIWICKECNGQICLNDGAAANNSVLCGGGLIEEGKCTKRCSDGKRDCDGICLAINSKAAGASYQCEFECQSGMGADGTCYECTSNDQCVRGVCNTELRQCVEYFNGEYGCELNGKDYIPCEASHTCVRPSSKKNGEGYSCLNECVSGYGEGGTCRQEPWKKFLFFVSGLLAISIIFAAAFYKFEFNKKAEQLEQMSAQYDELDAHLKQKTSEIQKLEKKNSELKKVLDTEQNTIRKQLIEEREKNRKEMETLKSEKEELIKHRDELFDEMRTPFPCDVPQLKGKYVYIEPEQGGYVCFYNKDNDVPHSQKPIHQWLAKKFIYQKFPEIYPNYPYKYQVHHINNNKLDNRIENLVIATGQQHQEVHRYLDLQMAGPEAVKKANIPTPHLN